MRPLSPPRSRFPRSTTQSIVDVDCTRVVHVLYWSVYSRSTAGKGSTCSTGGVCGDCGDLFVCGVFSVWLGEFILFGPRGGSLLLIDVLADTFFLPGTGLLDLRLGDSYCSTASTQRLYCSSDTVAVQFRRSPSNSDDDCDGG